MGSIGNTQNTVTERPIDTTVTKRQLKSHVTSALKAAGLTKAETYSTSIRGYRSVRRAGFDWGEEYGGAEPSNIRYIGGARSTNTDAYLDQVENALKDRFKLSRRSDSVVILGEYERR